MQKHTVVDLDKWSCPKKPIVPTVESAHERYRPRRGVAGAAVDGRLRPAAHTKKASRSVGPGGLRRFELKM